MSPCFMWPPYPCQHTPISTIFLSFAITLGTQKNTNNKQTKPSSCLVRRTQVQVLGGGGDVQRLDMGSARGIGRVFFALHTP